MASKKNKEILNLDVSCNFKLIAISTQLNINKLVWELNNAFGFKLVRNTEQEQANPFPTFTTRYFKSAHTISLIQNKYEGKALVKQLNNIDFILELTGEISDEDLKTHLQSVKKIPNIIAAIEIIPSSIKRNEPFCPE